MQAFPKYLEVSNKLVLNKCRYNWALKELRKAITLHMLQYDYTDSDADPHPTENNYFNIDEFYKSIGIVNNSDLTLSLYEKVSKELEEIGWNCKLSFGQTAMFIYSTENKPSSCWDDEF